MGGGFTSSTRRIVSRPNFPASRILSLRSDSTVCNIVLFAFLDYCTGFDSKTRRVEIDARARADTGNKIVRVSQLVNT